MRFISEAPSARLGARCEPRNTARSRMWYTMNRTVQRTTVLSPNSKMACPGHTHVHDDVAAGLLLFDAGTEFTVHRLILEACSGSASPAKCERIWFQPKCNLSVACTQILFKQYDAPSLSAKRDARSKTLLADHFLVGSDRFDDSLEPPDRGTRNWNAVCLRLCHTVLLYPTCSLRSAWLPVLQTL